MKLASLKHGRDGRLVVVSDDLAWCVDASPVAETLQAALDDWAHAEPKLRALEENLAHGSVPKRRMPVTAPCRPYAGQNEMTSTSCRAVSCHNTSTLATDASAPSTRPAPVRR